MGLSNNDIVSIHENSNTKLQTLIDSLNTLKTQNDGYRTQYTELQKNLNELNKAIKAMIVLNDSVILAKLNSKKDSTLIEMENLTNLISTNDATIENIQASILSISELVS